ncbi:hypothetical protein K439DRAFT_1612794 [Ramaria rubella]|nr:hypothetical protein K439DRAFT_1612794 [Ramaria rubella]
MVAGLPGQFPDDTKPVCPPRLDTEFMANIPQNDSPSADAPQNHIQIDVMGTSDDHHVTNNVSQSNNPLLIDIPQGCIKSDSMIICEDHATNDVPLGKKDITQAHVDSDSMSICEDHVTNNIPLGNGSSVTVTNVPQLEAHVKNDTMDTSKDHPEKNTMVLPSLDLANRIKGYQLLELITKQATGRLGEFT